MEVFSLNPLESDPGAARRRLARLAWRLRRSHRQLRQVARAAKVRAVLIEAREPNMA